MNMRHEARIDVFVRPAFFFQFTAHLDVSAFRRFC